LNFLTSNLLVEISIFNISPYSQPLGLIPIVVKLIYFGINCWETTAMIPIVETNNRLTTIVVVHTQYRDRRCEIVTICNTCKRKQLHSKLVILRKRVKNEHEDLT